MSDRLYSGRLMASVSEVVDASAEVLPHFELAAVPVLDGQERPGEEPSVRRRLRAEGVRAAEHRGALLLEPGDLDRMSSTALFGGGDEVYLVTEWDDEFEPFPGRVTPDLHDFSESTPLGLEEWMVDSGCMLVVGDGRGANYATFHKELHDRLRAMFKPAKN